MVVYRAKVTGFRPSFRNGEVVPVHAMNGTKTACGVEGIFPSRTPREVTCKRCQKSGVVEAVQDN